MAAAAVKSASWLDRAVLVPAGSVRAGVEVHDGHGTTHTTDGEDGVDDSFITSFAVLPTPPPHGVEPKPLVPQPCQLHVGDSEAAPGEGGDVPSVRMEITRVVVVEPLAPTPAPMADGASGGPAVHGRDRAGSTLGNPRVRFATVTVHYHERQVGGSCGVPSSGVDLGIGWSTAHSPRVQTVDEFEAAKLGGDGAGPDAVDSSGNGPTAGAVEGAQAGPASTSTAPSADRDSGSESDSDSDSSDGKAWRYDLYGKLDARERRRIMQAAGAPEADILAAIAEHKRVRNQRLETARSRTGRMVMFGRDPDEVASWEVEALAKDRADEAARKEAAAKAKVEREAQERRAREAAAAAADAPAPVARKPRQRSFSVSAANPLSLATRRGSTGSGAGSATQAAPAPASATSTGTKATTGKRQARRKLGSITEGSDPAPPSSTAAEAAAHVQPATSATRGQARARGRVARARRHSSFVGGSRDNAVLKSAGGGDTPVLADSAAAGASAGTADGSAATVQDPTAAKAERARRMKALGVSGRRNSLFAGAGASRTGKGRGRGRGKGRGRRSSNPANA